METANINPVELKVFLNHVYEFKKGVRQMVLYTMNKKYEDFAVRRQKTRELLEEMLDELRIEEEEK